MERPLRVLVIEDTPDDAELMILALRMGGLAPDWKRVSTADDLRAALATESWDAVLSDYTLPDFGATAALQIVRAAHPDTPFLVVSGTVGEEVAAGTMRAGANDYILKQNLTRLAPALDRELRESENRRARKEANEAMRASETRYRRLFEAAQDGILIVDPVSRSILDVNPFLTNLLGFHRDELVGKELWEIGLFHDIEANKAAFRELQQTGYIRYDNHPLKTKAGLQVEVEFVSNTYNVGDTSVIQCNIRDITARKRAERALRDSENRLRAIIQAEPECVKVVSREGCLEEMNPAGLAMLEAGSVAEARQQSLVEFIVPEHRAAYVDLHDRVFNGENGTLEYETIGLKGKRLWLDTHATPLRDGDGEIQSLLGISRDVTERKQAEHALRASEDRYRTLIAATTAIVWSSGPSGEFETEQPGWTAFTGQTAEQLGWGRLKVIHPDDTEKVVQEWTTAVQERSMYRMEHRLRQGDGEYRHVSVQAVPIFGPGGAILEWVGVHTDVTDQKLAEEALRTSEEEFRTLAEAVPQIFWITQPDGSTIYINQQWIDYTGLTLEESLGDGWKKPFHPDDVAGAWLAWQHALTTSGTYSIESRLRRADGVYRWWLIRGVALRDADGNILKWFGTCTDIDELKRVEVERTELLTQLNRQVERMPLAYLLTDPVFRYTRWNPAAERMFGFTQAEVLGRHPQECIVPPQSQSFVAGIFARLAGGDMHAHGTSENVTKDGKTITCEWHNTPLFGPDGAFQGVLSLAQDVSARRQAEESLLLRDRAIQAATQGLLITDPGQADDPIIYVSPGFERITGYRSEDVVGRNCRFLQGKDTDPTAVARLREAIQAGKACTVELLNYRKDGTPFWNELSVSPIWDEAGQLTHFVGVQSDSSSRRKLEEQFRQAQKMEAFGQLAGGVAHDFNNLLTIINGYSALLLQSLPPTDPSRDMVDEIFKAGERSASLTRQLLAFSRQQVLAPRILDLNEVVTDTDKLLRRLIGEDVRLATSLESALWSVRADPGQVEQVLMNLAVNARDAMPQGGRLTIETQNVELDERYAVMHPDVRPGPQVLLSVTDTGTGMSPEVKAKIFEPFFTTKGAGKGTGLGLATVYGIVKQSGGHVAVYSEVGVGTTVKVYLPSVEPAGENSKTVLAAHVLSRGTETVLLVEDEDAVRALTRHVLVACGYSVVEAASGEEALRLLADHDGTIHLLVTDVVMPGIGGRVVAEQVAKNYPEVQVLFVSGYTDDAVIRHGVLREGVNFLQKPYSPAALATKVREILDHAKQLSLAGSHPLAGV